MILLLTLGTTWADDGTGTGAATVPKKSWFQRHFGRQTIEEVLASATEPNAVCRAVFRRMGYQREGGDYWQTLEESWTRGRGDCEDFAVCVQTLCHQLGFDAHVYLFFPLGGVRDGHAVAVGQWNGQLWMSDLGTYEEVKSMDEVRSKVSRALGCDKRRMQVTRLDHEDLRRFLHRSPDPRPVGTP